MRAHSDTPELSAAKAASKAAKSQFWRMTRTNNQEEPKGPEKEERKALHRIRDPRRAFPTSSVPRHLWRCARRCQRLQHNGLQAIPSTMLARARHGASFVVPLVDSLEWKTKSLLGGSVLHFSNKPTKCSDKKGSLEKLSPRCTTRGSQVHLSPSQQPTSPRHDAIHSQRLIKGCTQGPHVGGS